jgi:hypothetical protein
MYQGLRFKVYGLGFRVQGCGSHRDDSESCGGPGRGVESWPCSSNLEVGFGVVFRVQGYGLKDKVWIWDYVCGLR